MSSGTQTGPGPLSLIKKVVFIAEMKNPSASGRQRAWALSESRLEVHAVDVADYPSALGRYASHLARMTRQYHLRYDRKKLELDILALCQQVVPDLIWFEWPRYLTPHFLTRLKSAFPKTFLISFQDDNPFGTRRHDFWHWKNYLQSVPHFDLHLVKRPSDIEKLKQYGATRSRLWLHGIYRPIFHPPEGAVEKRYPVSFVGTCLDDRSRLFEFLLAKENLPVHVFGNSWQKRSTLPRRFPELFHPAVEGDPYAEVIQKSHLCLGLVSSSNRDEWTMRTFEIPGCAGALVAERTPMHESLFREGEEAIFFSNETECAEAIRKLLADSSHAENMGTAAYHRCVRDNHFLEERMRALLSEL